MSFIYLLTSIGIHTLSFTLKVWKNSPLKKGGNKLITALMKIYIYTYAHTYTIIFYKINLSQNSQLDLIDIS